ncbi:tyrosine-type recombinase/integrase [Amycolatopsis pittospori]|uniref:tyrosine-type recombinase/integrase n=1 Tax=Amycolatopsis pittospori TaxID=2749434 RepID=UPI0015F10E06|nr:site-specific integrase [Amycolatopsis pittospori]
MATNREDGTETFDERWMAEAAQVVLYRRMEALYEELGDPQDRKTFRHPFLDVSREYLREEENRLSRTGGKERGGTFNTRKTRRNQVNQLCKVFAKDDIRQIDQVRFLEYLDELEEDGFSTASLAGRLTYMRQVMAFASLRGYIEDDCTRGLSISVDRLREPRILTDQELCLLSNYVPRWYYVALLLAFDCGLRAAEVAGLRWLRVDLDAKIPKVTVKDVMEVGKTLRGYPKGKTTEDVYLTPRCVEALRELQRWRPDDGPEGFIFRNEKGAPMSPSDPSLILQLAWDATGLEGERPRFHALRHACATNLAEAGAPLDVIVRRMRHRNTQTTMKYIRRSLEREAEWAGRVQDATNDQVISLHRTRAAQADRGRNAGWRGLIEGVRRREGKQ